MNEITLSEWLDIWLKLYAKPFIKKSTLVSYDCYINISIISVKRKKKAAITKLREFLK